MKIDPSKYDIERAKRQMSNGDVAQALDMSLGWVAAQNTRIKRGENLLPATVGRLAVAIGCPVEALLADVGEGTAA